MGIHAQTVQKLYVAYFSRPADVAGLWYWENVIARANGSTVAVSVAFSASSEYQAEYGGKDAAAMVEAIYQNLFGRKAETAARDYWGTALTRGDVTIADAVTTIAAAAQGSDKTAYANKVIGATAFTAALDVTSEILAYDGPSANAMGKVFLAGITTDASLAAAIAPPALDAFIRAMERGEPPPPPQPIYTVYDVTGLNKVFDTDQINAPGKAFEFLAKGSVGNAAITNVSASSVFRATADMGTSELTIIQKAPGPLTVTLAAAETEAADVPADSVVARVRVGDPTSLKVVFETAFRPGIPGEATAGDNLATFHVVGSTTQMELFSGGTFAHNELNYTDTAGALTALKVTGASDLTLKASATTALATVDASALGGRLVVSTGILADGGVIKLGSGADTVTVAASSDEGGPEAVANFSRASIAAVGPDGTAAAAAQAVADVLWFGGSGTVADANGGVTGGKIVNGVLSFTGAGPTDLGSALAIASLAAESPGETVLFEYVGRSYVFQQGTDLVVQLAGVTGVTHLGEIDDLFFIV